MQVYRAVMYVFMYACASMYVCMYVCINMFKENRATAKTRNMQYANLSS